MPLLACPVGEFGTDPADCPTCQGRNWIRPDPTTVTEWCTVHESNHDDATADDDCETVWVAWPPTPLEIYDPAEWSGEEQA